METTDTRRSLRCRGCGNVTMHEVTTKTLKDGAGRVVNRIETTRCLDSTCNHVETTYG